jgi:hypothetical protein
LNGLRVEGYDTTTYYCASFTGGVVRCQAGTYNTSMNMAFQAQSGKFVGTITNNGSNASYNTSSDIRLKKNIKPIIGALETISKLKASNFDYIINDYNTDGFVAQEIIKVLPYTTYKPENPEEMWSVDYSKLTPILTAGIQELIEINKELLHRIELLEMKTN